MSAASLFLGLVRGPRICCSLSTFTWVRGPSIYCSLSKFTWVRGPRISCSLSTFTWVRGARICCKSVNIYLQRQSVCPSVCVFVSPCHNIDTGVGRRRFAARGTDLVACTDPFILCIIQSTNTSVCTWGWERSGGAGILTPRFDLTSKSEVGIQLKKLRIVRHYWGIQVKELTAEIHSDKGTSQATQEYVDATANSAVFYSKSFLMLKLLLLQYLSNTFF